MEYRNHGNCSAEGLSILHTQNLAFIHRILSQHKDDELICYGVMNCMY